jgi:hypothetical protein
MANESVGIRPLLIIIVTRTGHSSINLLPFPSLLLVGKWSFSAWNYGFVLWISWVLWIWISCHTNSGPYDRSGT